MPAFKDMTGSQNRAKNGQLMTIIAYKNSTNVTVQFEDGTIVKNKSLANFRIGNIKNPNLTDTRVVMNRVGEKRKMHCGLMATIIEYRKYIDIKIQFEDGYVKKATYNRFKKGTISHKTVKTIHKHRDNVGDTRINKDGELIELIRYKNNYDVDIKFEDGYIWKNTEIRNFHNGVHNPNKKINRVGEHKLMNCGLEAKIIEYRSAEDIDIEFEDGTVAKHKWYGDFQDGSISHPNLNTRLNSLKLKRIGETIILNCGFKATLIEYRNANDIDVRFEDGAVAEHKSYCCFKDGTIMHPGFANVRYHGSINNLRIYGAINKDAKIYRCKCNKCNKEMLLTPELILKHKCSR